MMIVPRKYEELIRLVEADAIQRGEVPAGLDPVQSLMRTLWVSIDTVETTVTELVGRVFYMGAWALRECTAHYLINERMPYFRPLTWTVWTPHLQDPDGRPDESCLRLRSLAWLSAIPANDDVQAEARLPCAYPLVIPAHYEPEIHRLARDVGVSVEHALCAVLELGLSAALYSITCREMERAGALVPLPGGGWERVKNT